MRCLLALCAFALISNLNAAEKPTIVDVWPGKPPGEMMDAAPDVVQPTKAGEDSPTLRIASVTKPTISIFKPAKPNGAAVVIAPGGGYNILAWDKEGEEVAQWLNTLGVTGIVLKYRVPRRPGDPKGEPPLGPKQDAQRAISLVRSKASEWGIDPKKIGMLGFSAGGHLTAWTATNFDKRSYTPVDETDKASCRPDFAVLIYPAYLAATDGLTADIRVTKETPRTFLAHAGDDRVKAESSIFFYMAVRKLSVPAELHVFPTGGHGFGLRPSKHPVSEWPALCGKWMATEGLIPSSK